MTSPMITEVRKWNSMSVRNVCVNNDLYTCGCNEDYIRLLDEVNLMEPTKENIYRVATDIVKHSDEQTVSNVMFLLANQAVTVSFAIAE